MSSLSKFWSHVISPAMFAGFFLEGMLCILLCLQGVPQHLAGPRSRLEDSSLQTHGLPGQRVSQHQPRLENDTRGLGLGQVSNHCLDWRIAFPFSLIVATCCVLTSGREWCCVKVWVQKIDWK